MKKFDPCSSNRISREVPVGPVIHKMDKMLSRNIAAQMRAAGMDEITLMHGWIIRYLYEKREEEIFQKDIEKFFSIGRSTVTNIIQLMERNGYIARESVPGDARLKKVKLTDKGIINHEMVEAFITRLDRELIRGITEEELNTFYTVMDKIRGNLRCDQTAGEEEEHAACIVERSKGI
ncbi:MAG: MarR family transcriptional regulator [Dorea sp.]|nr:MarR family transcriptional regulator [Dorea sp.]